MVEYIPVLIGALLTGGIGVKVFEWFTNRRKDKATTAVVAGDAVEKLNKQVDVLIQDKIERDSNELRLIAKNQENQIQIEHLHAIKDNIEKRYETVLKDLGGLAEAEKRCQQDMQRLQKQVDDLQRQVSG